MKYIFAIMIIVGLSACSSIPLKPEAKFVRLTKNEPDRTCQFLGDITGNQGDFFTGEFTSNEDLESGARNDLKNQAYDIGGNVIYLLTERAGQTGSFHHEYGGGTSQTNVTLSGNVYYCPMG